MFADVALKEQTTPLTYRIPSSLLLGVSQGSLVKVSFRGKKSLGAVVGLKKSLPVQLKNKKILAIGKIICASWVPIATLSLAKLISKATTVPIGVIIFRLMPPVLKRSLSSAPVNQDPPQNLSTQRFHLYGSLKSRGATYIEIIRRAKAQVLIVAPQLHISFLVQIFKAQNIDFALADSVSSNSHDLKTFNDFLSGKITILLGTRKIIGWQGKNLRTIVVDDPISLAHKDDQRPYLDSASLALFRKKLGVNVIFGAPIVTPELLFSEKSGRAKRLKSPQESLPIEIVELKKGLLSTSLTSFALKNQQIPIYIICPRKGVGGTMRCLDCDSILECLSCKAPVFFGLQNKCQECGLAISAAQCQNCQGYNLQSFGIGTEAFAKAIKKEFNTAPQNIHLITEGELSLIPENSLIVLGFADAPLSSPDLLRPYRLLGIVRDLASRYQVIIQTKKLDSSWWQILANNPDALEKSLQERQKFNLSPFSKIYTVVGKSPKLEATLKQRGCEFVKNNDTLEISVSSNQKIDFSNLGVKNIKLKLPSLI